MSAGIPSLLQDVRDGVRAQPGRMGLSFLSIAVGVTALTILLAVLGGLQERSRQIVQELGVNVFGIVPSSRSARSGSGEGRLTAQHVELLTANLPDCVLAGLARYDVPVAGVTRSVSILATDSALLSVRQWRMTSGRFLDPRDEDARARVAVVSADLSQERNWNVGDTLSLRSMPYDIVGVVDCSAGAIETEAADPSLLLGTRAVFVPRKTPPYWEERSGPSPSLDAVFVRVPDPARFASALARARRLLAQPDQGSGEVGWITPDHLLQRLRRLQNTIKLTVGSIAALCLMLGGTTLMSLMVANVRDRVTEIGLRRALGATPRDIAALFVLEAALVTAAAALVAVLGTHLVLFAVQGRLPVPIAVNRVTALLPLLVAVVLGVSFSYWPARIAARIAPSEALRND